MNVSLTPEHLNLVLSILKAHDLVDHAYVFGSRARGDHQPYSDLDLLIKRSAELESRLLTKINADFEKSNLPFTVDIAEWIKLSDDFKSRIALDIIKLI